MITRCTWERTFLLASPVFAITRKSGWHQSADYGTNGKFTVAVPLGLRFTVFVVLPHRAFNSWSDNLGVICGAQSFSTASTFGTLSVFLTESPLCRIGECLFFTLIADLVEGGQLSGACDTKNFVRFSGSLNFSFVRFALYDNRDTVPECSRLFHAPTPRRSRRGRA
jgi:hypothetical protein